MKKTDIKNLIQLREELDDYDFKQINEEIVCAIYCYHTFSCEGDGYFIAKNQEGEWLNYELGHCSCYGPLESGYTGKFTKEEILKIVEEIEVKDNSDYYIKADEKEKIKDFIKNN